MNLLRGFADDTPLEAWLQEHIWPTEAAHMGREFVRDGTELALAESLLNGVTTVNDMYFFPDEVAKTCREVGMRATVGLLVFDFPTAWANSVDEYFSRGLSLHDEIKDDPLISTAFAPHAPYTVSQAPLERIATLAAELDLPVHMHVHETASEVEQFETVHGVRPLQRLDDIGLLNPSLLAVHLTQLTDDEIHRLSETGVSVIHCPESNLKLASGICRIPDLLDSDVNIAVGTDGVASNNDLDLIGELRTATFLAKVTSGNAATLNASTALRMITINAAKALGLDKEIGSLEIGKSADCILIQPDLGMVPVYDAQAQVVYTNSSPCVSDVWVAGKQLLKNRQLLTLDAERLHSTAKSWSSKISKNATQH
jgi:5-methylthioadenosine/S-adenosylhomocysteine deaminase